MLKVYTIVSYCRVDDGDWFQVGSRSQGISEELSSSEVLIFDEVSWKTVFDYLQKVACSDMSWGRTLFLSRPFIEVTKRGADWATRYYEGDFSWFSYKHVCIECTDFSLSWLWRYGGGDTVLQYLKERGVAVHPLI